MKRKRQDRRETNPTYITTAIILTLSLGLCDRILRLQQIIRRLSPLHLQPRRHWPLLLDSSDPRVTQCFRRRHALFWVFHQQAGDKGFCCFCNLVPVLRRRMRKVKTQENEKERKKQKQKQKRFFFFFGFHNFEYVFLKFIYLHSPGKETCSLH